MKSNCCNQKIESYINGEYCSKCFTKQVKSKVILKLFTFLLFSFIFLSFSVIGNKPLIIQKITATPEEIKDITLTDSSIIEELIKQHCLLPNIALAQTKIESAHFTSKICKENKNIFGIKHNPAGFSKGIKNGHAYYEKYIDCISDYIRIQNMYLNKINGKYAEDKNYIKKLKTIK